MISDAGKRCRVLFAEHSDLADAELEMLCLTDLHKGFPFLPDHMIRDIVKYHLRLRRGEV